MTGGAAARAVTRLGVCDPPSRADLLRLLEVGDGEDLRWLLAHQGAANLTAFVTSEGWRLSRRSRRFWHSVLGAPETPAGELGPALWPLS